MLDDHESPPENPIYEPDEPPIAGLPSLLRNWQVIEIEGEATPVAERPAPPRAPQDQTIPDHLDDVLVATLDQRHLTVAAGKAATFELTVCNKGDRTALFQIFVDGWIDERWISTPGPDGQPAPGHLPLHVLLHPGEHATRAIIITPPRAAKVVAGDHPLAIVVRAPEYAQRFNRQSALLVIKPYLDFSLGPARPQALNFSWFTRTAPITVTVTNRSNCTTTFRLQGADSHRQLGVEFRLPGLTPQPSQPARPVRTPAKGRARPTYRPYIKHRTPVPAPKSPPTITLQPGQAVQLPVVVTARSLPFFAWQARTSTIRIGVTPVDEPTMLRTATVEVDCKPLLRPWHMGALMSFFLLALVGAGVMLVMGLLMLRVNQNAARPSPTNPVAPPPVITILVNLPANQPDGLPATADPAPIISAPEARANAGDPAGPALTADPALPFVLPEQISAPGSTAPSSLAPVAQPALAAPVANAQPVSTEQPLTYQQLFRAIGRRYDLNWRTLAAQAYIESSFDSVALGNAGAMGLMQIMPNTWREWAPVVEVSDPFDSYSNALVAAVYLDYLRTLLGEQGHPEAEWMLVAYNWGIDKVLRHLEAGQGWDELPPETRQYALDILQIAATIPAN